MEDGGKVILGQRGAEHFNQIWHWSASDGRRLKTLHLADHSGIKLLHNVPYRIGGTKSKSKLFFNVLSNTLVRSFVRSITY